MKSTILTLAILLFLAALSGCGQSGPLYIPGDPSSVKSEPTVETSEDEAEENGEDDNR